MKILVSKGLEGEMNNLELALGMCLQNTAELMVDCDLKWNTFDIGDSSCSIHYRHIYIKFTI